MAGSMAAKAWSVLRNKWYGLQLDDADNLKAQEQGAIAWENPYSSTDGQIVTSPAELYHKRIERAGVVRGNTLLGAGPVTLGAGAALNNIILAAVTSTKTAQVVGCYIDIEVAGQAGDYACLRDKSNNEMFACHLLAAGRIVIPEFALTPFNATTRQPVAITGSGSQDLKLQITTTAGSPLLSKKVYAGVFWTER